MQFNDYNTQYDIFMRSPEGRVIKTVERETGAKRVDIVYEQLLHTLFRHFKATGSSDADLARVINGYQMERRWIYAKRPFYNLYPGIVPYLLRLDLSKVPVEAFQMPVSQLVFRFPLVQNPMTISLRSGPCQGQTWPLMTLLAAMRDCNDPDTLQSQDASFAPGERALLTTFQWNPRPGNMETAMHLTSSLWLKSQGTLEDSIEQLRDKLGEGDIEIESYLAAMRLIVTTCLLSTHWEDEIVLPCVLREDENKWHQTHDEKFITRAAKRGVVGWTVGKGFEERREVAPHWRGPSPLALYWTGPGGKTPLYRYRRGTIVHRSQIENVPTGHEGEG